MRGLAFTAVLLAGALSSLAAAAPDPPADRRSGFEEMSPDSQILQLDDTANPGMLSVLEGENLWQSEAGLANKACADCHGQASTSMRGVAARYPRPGPQGERPRDLQSQINLCRSEHQSAAPWPLESPPLLSMSAYIAHQSRGLPISPPDDARLLPARARGEALYSQRMGQLNLACAQCHDTYAGARLGASPIPQAHPTGYPLYRLQWQSLGSLQRRLRNCMVGMRAEPFAYGSDEFIDLEVFLTWRARQMTIETPAIRP